MIINDSAWDLHRFYVYCSYSKNDFIEVDLEISEVEEILKSGKITFLRCYSEFNSNKLTKDNYIIFCIDGKFRCINLSDKKINILNVENNFPNIKITWLTKEIRIMEVRDEYILFHEKYSNFNIVNRDSEYYDVFLELYNLEVLKNEYK